MVAVTVAPAMAASPAAIDCETPSTCAMTAWFGVCVSAFSSSLKVTTSAAPFTAAEENAGRVVSAGVLLVTALAEKPGTRSIALSAALSRFAPAV